MSRETGFFLILFLLPIVVPICYRRGLHFLINLGLQGFVIWFTIWSTTKFGYDPQAIGSIALPVWIVTAAIALHSRASRRREDRENAMLTELRRLNAR